MSAKIIVIGQPAYNVEREAKKTASQLVEMGLIKLKNPYEKLPIIETYKDGKQKRRERRKQERKNLNRKTQKMKKTKNLKAEICTQAAEAIFEGREGFCCNAVERLAPPTRRGNLHSKEIKADIHNDAIAEAKQTKVFYYSNTAVFPFAEYLGRVTYLLFMAEFYKSEN